MCFPRRTPGAARTPTRRPRSGGQTFTGWRTPNSQVSDCLCRVGDWQGGPGVRAAFETRGTCLLQLSSHAGAARRVRPRPVRYGPPTGWMLDDVGGTKHAIPDRAQPPRGRRQRLALRRLGQVLQRRHRSPRVECLVFRSGRGSRRQHGLIDDRQFDNLKPGDPAIAGLFLSIPP